MTKSNYTHCDALYFTYILWNYGTYVSKVSKRVSSVSDSVSTHKAWIYGVVVVCNIYVHLAEAAKTHLRGGVLAQEKMWQSLLDDERNHWIP